VSDKLTERAGEALPAVVAAPEPGIPAASWLGANWPDLEAPLERAGALLLRGFAITSADEFREAVAAAMPDLVDYEEPSTPRTAVGGQVFTSTEYPRDQSIPMHTEMSYRHSWPRYLWFWCETPASVKGETPLADYRRVLARMPDDLVRPFADKGVMYRRRYNTGFDLTWQQVYGTEDRDEVEKRLRGDGVEHEWCGGEVLETRRVVEALVTHPGSGERAWFNQVNLFHPSALAPETRDALEAALGKDGTPRGAYYGDGGEIADETLATIREAIAAEKLNHAWQRGDLVVVDNLSTAHGREPFDGPRRILVAMTGRMDSRYRIGAAVE
jgi:alpha-ketoglutarate-dependent taurine dioxygenase